MPIQTNTIKRKFISSTNLLRLELIIGFFVVNFFGLFYSELGHIGFSLNSTFSLSLLYLLVFVATLVLKLERKKIKTLLLILYDLSLLFVIWICFQNNFKTEYVFSFLFIYSFFVFSQDRIKQFLYTNLFIFSVLLTLVWIKRDVIDFSISILLFSFSVIFLTGFAITYSRSVSKRKLISRKNLLNHIFNQSSDGLILVDKNSLKIIELNQKAVLIFNFNDRKDLLGKSIEELKLSSRKITEYIGKDTTQSIELDDKRILNLASKSIEYINNDFWLIDIKEYKGLNELNLSAEFDRLRSVSEDNYKYLFEQSSSMICIINQEGKIIDVNSTLCKTVNYTKSELLDKKYSFLNFSEIKNRESINEKAWGGENQVFEKSIKSKEGKIIEIETILRKGKYLGEEVLISNSRDISKRKELERKVQFNLKRYTTLFELSPIGIVVTDLDGNILSCNQSFSRMVEYDVNEIKNLNVNDITFKEDMKVNLDLRHKLVEGEVQFLEMEKRYLSKNNNEVHVLLKSVIQKDEDNNAQSILSQVVDITDIKNTQKKLEVSEKSYRDLFDNSYDLLYILNKKNEFIDVNKAVIKKYGYSKEEIIGQTPHLFSAPDLNDLEIVKNLLKKAHSGKEQSLLWWSKKKNGEVFPKDLNLKRVFYHGEEVLMASGRDISDSYNYERKLEEKEKRYRDLFERNLAGVYRTTYDGKLLECNNSFAKILGFKDKNEIQKEANAKDFYVYKKERDDLLHELKIKKHIKGNKIHLKRKNGVEITALLNVSAIYDANQKFSYFEGSLIDITELDRAQKLLKESQEKYRKLIDNAAFGVLIFHESKNIFSNDKAKEILNFRDDESVFGINHNQLIRKSDEVNFLEMLQSLENGEELPFVEMKMKGKEGLVVDVELKASKVNFENKECLLISFIDITDRKKVERVQAKARSAETFNKILQAELKEKEKAQKRLVDAQSYTEGIIQSSLDMIFTTDINARFNKLNNAAVKELRIDNKDAEKKSIDIIFKNKEEAKNVLFSLEKNKTFSGEVQLLRADQTTFPAYLSLSYLYNSDDVVLGIMGVGRDISIIKQKEIEIKQQAAKLNAIIESSSHFFFTVNRDYFITSFNHVFQSDVVNNIGKHISEDIHFFEIFPNYLKEEYEALSAFWTEKFNQSFHGKSINFEIKRKDLDGNIYYREFYLNPIYNDNEEVVEVSGIGHDITDKKQSEKKLRNSLREKDVLLKEVHHRVKNNMQVISSILNLQTAYVEDEGVLDILRESQNRIKSMAIIHEKLYRTKDFSLIKFSEYVQHLSQNLVDTYELSSVDVKLNYNLDEVFLNIDSAIPCGLIINELISNSLKYAFVNKSNGVIFIDLHQNSNEVTLRIGDNGIGFPNEIDYKNTDSLGLQLVNTLVEQLEGSIALDNSRGATFTIKFKIKDSKDV